FRSITVCSLPVLRPFLSLSSSLLPSSSAAPATSVFYTLSLHDALPILAPFEVAVRGGCAPLPRCQLVGVHPEAHRASGESPFGPDRKSTRLNSSHVKISYAVFCLKKKRHLPIPIRKSSIPAAVPHTGSNGEDG